VWHRHGAFFCLLAARNRIDCPVHEPNATLILTLNAYPPWFICSADEPRFFDAGKKMFVVLDFRGKNLKRLCNLPWQTRRNSIRAGAIGGSPSKNVTRSCSRRVGSGKRFQSSLIFGIRSG